MDKKEEEKFVYFHQIPFSWISKSTGINVLDYQTPVIIDVCDLKT